jgi:hypothetical protein
MIFEIPEIVLNIFRFVDKRTLIRATSSVSSNFCALSNYELKTNRKTKWEQIYDQFKTNQQLQTKNLNNFRFPNIKFLLDDNSGIIIVLVKENDANSIYFTHFYDTKKFLHIHDVDAIRFKDLKITEIIPHLSVTGKTERILYIQTNHQTIYIIYTNVNDIRIIHRPLCSSIESLVWKQFKNDIRQYPIFVNEKSCVDFETESNLPKVYQFICPCFDKEVYIINFSREHRFFVVYLFKSRELIKRTPIKWKSDYDRAIIKKIPNSKQYIIININASKFHMFDLRLCKIIASYKCDNLFDIKRVYLMWCESSPVFIGICYDGIYIYRENDNFTKFEFGMDYYFEYDDEMDQILCNNFYVNKVFRIPLKSFLDLPKKSQYLFSQIKNTIKIHYNVKDQ